MEQQALFSIPKEISAAQYVDHLDLIAILDLKPRACEAFLQVGNAVNHVRRDGRLRCERLVVRRKGIGLVGPEVVGNLTLIEHCLQGSMAGGFGQQLMKIMFQAE